MEYFAIFLLQTLRPLDAYHACWMSGAIPQDETDAVWRPIQNLLRRIESLARHGSLFMRFYLAKHCLHLVKGMAVTTSRGASDASSQPFNSLWLSAHANQCL